MLMQKLRDGAQGIAAKVVIGLLVFVLAAFGFGTIDLFSVSEPVAATVNGEEVSQGDLEVAIARQRSIVRAQMGESANDELLDLIVTPDAVLGVLVDEALLAQAADDLDLAASAELVESRIRSDFAGISDLDETGFRNRLASAGYTPLGYQAEIVELELRSQLSGGFRDTGFVTDRELRRAAEVMTQRRDIAWLEFPLSAFEATVEVEEVDIEAHYETAIDDYMTEETFDFSYVSLPLAGLEAEVEVTDDEIVERHEAESLALADKPPRRRGSHILFEVNDDRTVDEAFALAEEARVRLADGADFAELAKELSDDLGSASEGGDLGMADRDTFVTPFADALWALEVDALSEPVESEFGVHLIRLQEVEEVVIPTLEERREGIASELRRSAARELFAERLREMDEVAFENPDSLDPLAEEFGLTVERQTGATRNSWEGLLADGGVRSAAFGDEVVIEGFNSRAVAAASDNIVVVRLDERHRALERPLDDVRDDIRAALVRERAEVLAQNAAAQALGEFRGGTPTADIAAEHGTEWQRADGAQQREPEVPGQVLESAFALEVPSDGRASDVAALAGGTHAVVVVSAVNLGDFAAMTEDERSSVRVELARLTSSRGMDALLGTLQGEADIDRVAFGTDDLVE